MNMWLFNSITAEIKEVPKSILKYKREKWEHFFLTKEEITLKVRRKLMAELIIPRERWVRVFDVNGEVIDEEIYLSNEGRVKRILPNGGELMLVPSIKDKKRNSAYITFKINGKRKGFLMTQLMASHFNLKGEGDCVYHIDKNVFNNSESNLRRIWRRDLVKFAIRKNKKPVIQIDAETGEELNYFSSIKEASQACFTHEEGIQRCVNGLQKESCGYRWVIDEVY